MKDIDKKIKELEKELKNLKEKAKEETKKEEVIEKIDNSDKVKGKDHKMKVTIYDETNNEYVFNDYIKGGIIVLKPATPKEDYNTYATAYTRCEVGDILGMLEASKKIQAELVNRVSDGLVDHLFNGLKDLLEGDEDNE